MAEQLPPKKNVGISHSTFTDQVYAQVEALYTEHSNHVSQLVSFVESNILPDFLTRANHHQQVKEYSRDLSLLDVGAGPGTITRQLSVHFSRVQVIEPNDEYIKAYSQEPHFIVHTSSIEDAIIPSNSYNLIICSHVLYHVPISKWMDCLSKLQAGLKQCPSGRLVLVLISPRGPWHDFLSCLRPKQDSGYYKLHSGTLRNTLDSIGLPYKMYPKKSRVVVPAAKLSGFRNLVRLFSIADTWSAQEWDELEAEERAKAEEKVEAYIQEQCFVQDREEYKLEIDEDYVVVTAADG